MGAVYRPDRSAGSGVVETPVLALVALGDLQDPHWGGEARKLDFYHVKGMVDSVLGRFDRRAGWVQAADIPYLHPGATARLHLGDEFGFGLCGELHPRLREELKIPGRAFYCELDLQPLYGTPISPPRFESLGKFQPVERDLSFLLDKTVAFNRIGSQVQALNVPDLKTFRLIDLYHGSGLPQGKVSLTVRLTFEAPGRTLTQAEIAERCELAVAGLRESLAIVLR
jgi:phenylalanyl-tRNA synthetase beta chain